MTYRFNGQAAGLLFLTALCGAIVVLTGPMGSKIEVAYEEAVLPEIQERVCPTCEICVECPPPVICRWEQLTVAEAIPVVDRAMKYLDENKRWYNGKRLPPILDANTRRFYAERVVLECYRKGIDPLRFTALLWIESGLNHKARSYAGARGLAQIMPFWVRDGGARLEELGIAYARGWTVDDLYKPEVSIRLGVDILAYYIKIRGGNVDRGMASYNGSTGHYWYPNKVNRIHKILIQQGFQIEEENDDM